MSAWLRNLHGQLTELASEVLSEATEEVDDPESELQVQKRKCTEAEKELLAERSSVETLQKKIADLEERMYAKDVEIESLNIKYTGMVDSRDAQIHSLQVELERLRNSHTFGDSFGEEGDEEGFLSSGMRSTRLKEEVAQLKKEVQHWKRIVKDSDSADLKTRIAELERKLSDQKAKSEVEMAALMQAHGENISRLKAEYEKKIQDAEAGPRAEGSEELRRVESETSTNDWQTAWDEVEVESSLGRVSVERLRDENRSILEDRDRLLKELREVRLENEAKSEKASEQSRHVETELNERLEALTAECNELRTRNDEASALVRKKDDELLELSAKLEEAHLLVDVQREKFERESCEEAEKNKAALAEAQSEVERVRLMAESRAVDVARAEEVAKEIAALAKTIALQKQQLTECKAKFEDAESVLIKDSSNKDRELEKLKRENSELTSAYNDLNEEFECHKAEHGSVVTSNRDLTARIDALKANLIEYEERYEMCKAENAETVLQLEKLTNDFERLRVSFEAAKGKTVIDAANEVEKLRKELESSREDGEKLRADVSRFRSAVGSIDVELNRLRELNEKLARDNVAMNASLNKFSEIRDMLEKSDTELCSLRDKFVQLQAEHHLKEKEWEERLVAATSEKEDALRELEECRMRVSERESALQRYRSVVGAHAADIVEMKAAEGKGSGSEGTTDSNNGWEKMADWDASAAAGSSSATQHGGTSIMEELREALAMITEKTEECEELRRQKGELEKELELRQNCADELMAQTNALQSQQQLQAEAFNQLREWANEKEREKLEMERNLVYTEEQLREMRSNLDEATAESERLRERLREVGSSVTTEEAVVAELREDIERLNAKYAKCKQQDESDLNSLREEKNVLLENARKAAEGERKLKEALLEKDASHKELQAQLIMKEEEIRKYDFEQTEANEQSYLQKKLLEDKIKELEKERMTFFEQLQASRVEIENFQTSQTRLQNQLSAMPSCNPEELERSMAECSKLRSSLEACENRVKELDSLNAAQFDELQTTRANLAKAEQVQRDLVALVEQKHAESLNYHSQLQAVLTDREERRADAAKCSAQIAALEERLAGCVEARDKSARESERLREHLLAVEESATRDAVLAEERETALRKRVRELEQKSEESADSVILSSNAYQRQIAELTEELEAARAERGDAVERLKANGRSLADTQLALSNLQRVLKDIGLDHEAQVSQYDEEIADLKADIDKLKSDIDSLRSKVKSLITEKQQLEDTAEHFKEEIAQRDVVIEELETQLDERGIGASLSSAATYHIDDQTLRQLFLSYFTAERDKRPDIAMLLASILGYSKDDISKIQAANESASRGWFGMGAPRRERPQAMSIAEQFVRFLEKESLTSATSRSLPVEKSTETSTIRSSAPAMVAGQSSSEELRSILDS